MIMAEASKYWIDLSSSYISYRLCLAGFPVSKSEQTNNVTCLEHRLSIVSYKCENEYCELFDQMMSHVSISLTFPDFLNVCDKMLFPTGKVTCVGIISVFSFSGLLAVKLGFDQAFRERIIDFLSTFLEAKVSYWIEKRGGMTYVIDNCIISSETHKTNEICDCNE